MKKIICLALALSLSAIFSKERINQENKTFQDDATLSKKESQVSKDKKDLISNWYCKVGSSFLIQNFGVGKRFHNLQEYSGHDFSFNFHLVLMGTGGGDGVFLPSLKYECLKYKKDNSSYFGVGAEVGGICRWKGRFDGVYPNIELIWGKQREKVKFTQFSVNLLPVVATVVGIISLSSSQPFLGHADLAVAVFGFLSIFEYTVAF